MSLGWPNSQGNNVTDDLSTALSNERNQLLETWKRVFAKTPDPCAAPFLQLDRLAKGSTDKKAISNDLRKFHDRFGWMAKESSSAGKCSGALYRTQAFIQLPSDERIGKKRGQTVHIEHTVPVNVLSMRWLEVRKSGQDFCMGDAPHRRHSIPSGRTKDAERRFQIYRLLC